MTTIDRPSKLATQYSLPKSETVVMSWSEIENAGIDQLAEWFVRCVPVGFARRYGLAGIEHDGTKTILQTKPTEADALDNLIRVLGSLVSIKLLELDDAEAQRFARVVAAGYQRYGSSASDLIGAKPVFNERADVTLKDLLDNTDQAKVVQIVDALLVEATRLVASDVHLQPTNKGLLVRMRIDGVLEERHTLPKAISNEVISRIKVMARMNVAEHRVPQDGRASVTLGDRSVDLRISSLPGSEGERIVVRVLDQSAVLLSLDHLGMPADCLALFQRMVTSPHGIVLVTGPTGSGKTTTLYSSLMSIDRQKLNIITIEDPIEYRLGGISQTQINEKVGLTFATGLRSMLRQDPDVMMIGEIRDHETAVMAIQASLTGHLVLSTLHTNDSVSSITRLVDLGLEPYLVASSILGILAQRLVRSICPACRQERQPTAVEQSYMGFDGNTAESIWHAPGCDVCRQTGYSGRRGIFELLEINDRIRESVQQGRPVSEMHGIARSCGLVPLAESARRLVRQGQTTMAEAERVTSHTVAAVAEASE